MSNYEAPKRVLNRVERNLLDALVALRQPENRTAWAGICYNVQERVADRDCVNIACCAIKELMQRWPGRAIDAHPGYPVEGSCAGYETSRFYAGLWADPRRMELLEWLIVEVTEVRLYDNADT